MVTCLRNNHAVSSPGGEPLTLELWVRRPNHSTTEPPYCYCCYYYYYDHHRYYVCLLMHLIHTGQSSQYLVDSVQSVITSSQRHLRSSETTVYVKRTTRTKFGERGFSYSGPAARNSLPSHLRTTTDTNVFKRHLKAFLFTESFS